MEQTHKESLRLLIITAVAIVVLLLVAAVRHANCVICFDNPIPLVESAIIDGVHVMKVYAPVRIGTNEWIKPGASRNIHFPCEEPLDEECRKKNTYKKEQHD